MVPEKLGLIKRFLLRIARKPVWWFSPKMNAFFVNLMLREGLRKYEEYYGVEKGLEILDEIAEKAAEPVVFELLDRIKMFFSKSVKDQKILIEAAFDILFGGEETRIMYIPPDEEGVHRIVIRFYRCIFCAGVDDITPESLGEQSYIIPVISGARMIAQMIQDQVGNEFDVRAKETACFLRGDPYGEITVYYFPRKS